MWSIATIFCSELDMTQYCGYVYVYKLVWLFWLTWPVKSVSSEKKKKELTIQFLTGMIIVLTSLTFFFLVEFTFF